MIRYLLFLGAGVPVTFFFSTVSLVGGLLRAPRELHDWVHRNWSRILLRLAGVRLVTEGTENLERHEAVVVVSNHQSLFDIFALFAALPVSLRFVAKKELDGIPVFSNAMRQAGHVFIDRSDRRQAVRTMRCAGERMREEGLALGLFPEGTRSPDGRLLPFKKGPFVLAIDTQTAIVPVAVEGGGRILPKGRRRLEPRPIHVRCGEVRTLRGLGREDRDELLRRTRERIAGMLEELHSAHRGTPGASGRPSRG